jgi:ubiquinone biosynthesis protein COQ9
MLRKYFAENSTGSQSTRPPITEIDAEGEEEEEPETEQLKDQIMKAALIHVSKTGFNDYCLVMACHDLNLSSASSRLIEKGPVEISYL